MKIKKVDQFLSKLLEVVCREDYTDKTEKSGLNTKTYISPITIKFVRTYRFVHFFLNHCQKFMFCKNPSYVLFVPYFRLSFWYFGHFSCMIGIFRSCPSCLAKCKQRLCNVFEFVNFVAKSDQKPKNEKWIERNISFKKSPYISFKNNIQFTIYSPFCI